MIEVLLLQDSSRNVAKTKFCLVKVRYDLDYWIQC